MSHAPAIFRRNISEHNRHCWIAAGLSLLGAVLSWALLVAGIVGLSLVLETIRTGDAGLRTPPRWMGVVLAGLVLLLLVWALIDRFAKRYRPVDDRSIIGWHLLPDFLLAPARMTFAVWDHISLCVVLSAAQRDEAWRLLEAIADRKRVATSELGQFFPDAKTLPKLLFALQLTGWIDLHRGDEDWFYVLRSDAEQNYRLLQS